MKLPGGDRATIDLAKLEDCCLNEHHSRGRHKARVFRAALGITRAADILREALLVAARDQEATPAEQDSYGQRYMIDFPMVGPEGSASLRSIWIVLVGEDRPRLVTCYVL